MRKRAGALYIKDRKLFLICEGKQTFFWTPGGGLENSETFEQALGRELYEELNAQLTSAELYMRIHDKAADELVCYYLVDLELPAKLPNDTEHYWFTREDYGSNAVNISKRIYHKVFPKLVEDNLV